MVLVGMGCAGHAQFHEQRCEAVGTRSSFHRRGRLGRALGEEVTRQSIDEVILPRKHVAASARPAPTIHPIGNLVGRWVLFPTLWCSFCGKLLIMTVTCS